MDRKNLRGDDVLEGSFHLVVDAHTGGRC
jgi:hypothetical protein